ncbi:MAG: hypothetical protein ACRCXT_03265 [Paraclostridium sp.]
MFKLEVIKDLVCKKKNVNSVKDFEYKMIESKFTVKDYDFSYNMLRVVDGDNHLETIVVDDHVDRFYYAGRKKDLLYNLANSIISESSSYCEIVCIANSIMSNGDISPISALRIMTNAIDLRIRYDIVANATIEVKGSDKIYFVKHLINAYNIKLLKECRHTEPCSNSELALSNLLWSTQSANISVDSLSVPYRAIYEGLIPYMSVTVLATLFKDNAYKKSLDIRANNVTGHFNIKIKDFFELNNLIDDYEYALKQY